MLSLVLAAALTVAPGPLDVICTEVTASYPPRCVAWQQVARPELPERVCVRAPTERPGPCLEWRDMRSLSIDTSITAGGVWSGAFVGYTDHMPTGTSGPRQ